jgi:hypothetical protein
MDRLTGMVMVPKWRQNRCSFYITRSAELQSPNFTVSRSRDACDCAPAFVGAERSQLSTLRDRLGRVAAMLQTVRRYRAPPCMRHRRRPLSDRRLWAATPTSSMARSRRATLLPDHGCHPWRTLNQRSTTISPRPYRMTAPRVSGLPRWSGREKSYPRSAAPSGHM